MYSFGFIFGSAVFANVISSVKLGINPYMTSALFHHYKLDESISKFRGVWWIFLFLFYF